MDTMRPRRNMRRAVVAAVLSTALLAGCGSGGPPADLGDDAGQTVGALEVGGSGSQGVAPGGGENVSVPGGESPANPGDHESRPENDSDNSASATATGEDEPANATAPDPDPDEEFLLVADYASLPASVQQWHESKRLLEGAFTVVADGQAYVLISAGSKPTGGYSLSLRSVKPAQDGWRLEVELHKPSPNAMVTQVVTYPTLFFTAPPGDVTVMLFDGAHARELPLNEGGGDVR